MDFIRRIEHCHCYRIPTIHLCIYSSRYVYKIAWFCQQINIHRISYRLSLKPGLVSVLNSKFYGGGGGIFATCTVQFSLLEEVCDIVVSSCLSCFNITLTGTGTGHVPVYTVIIRFPIINLERNTDTHIILHINHIQIHVHCICTILTSYYTRYMHPYHSNKRKFLAFFSQESIRDNAEHRTPIDISVQCRIFEQYKGLIDSQPCM